MLSPRMRMGSEVFRPVIEERRKSIFKWGLGMPKSPRVKGRPLYVARSEVGFKKRPSRVVGMEGAPKTLSVVFNNVCSLSLL